MDETKEGVGTCTNSAGGPVVSGKRRSFGILYCVHELVERGSESRILLWSVDGDAALQRHVSRVRKNSTQYDRTQTPPTCAWVLSTNEETIPCIPDERRSDCTFLVGSMTYKVVASTLFSRLRLSKQFCSGDRVMLLTLRAQKRSLYLSLLAVTGVPSGNTMLRATTLSEPRPYWFALKE